MGTQQRESLLLKITLLTKKGGKQNEVSCLRKRKCECPDRNGNRTEEQAPRCFLVAVHRLVVGSHLVDVLHHSSADHQDFCTEETETKATSQNCMRVPELRSQVVR